MVICFTFSDTHNFDFVKKNWDIFGIPGPSVYKLVTFTVALTKLNITASNNKNSFQKDFGHQGYTALTCNCWAKC